MNVSLHVPLRVISDEKLPPSGIPVETRRKQNTKTVVLSEAPKSFFVFFINMKELSVSRTEVMLLRELYAVNSEALMQELNCKVSFVYLYICIAVT